MDDKELKKEIINAKKGDEEAFAKIIHFFKLDFFRIAKSRLLDNEDAMDAVQETIISIFLNLNKLNKVDKFKNWATKILINNCNKIYSKSKNKNEVLYENISQIENLIITKNVPINDDYNYLFRNLDTNERTLITMFYIENYTSKDISKILGMNHNTVRANIFRIKNKIRKQIEREEECKN